MAPQRYPIPAGTVQAEVLIDRSRFVCLLGHAPTVEAAQAFIRARREACADATNNCWAYVAGPPGSAARIGMSDDGEPHGTAGRPMLVALQPRGVGEVVAVVTRYYGGTKLGTGGLVRAYTQAVQAALALLETVERRDRTALAVTADYGARTLVLRALSHCEGDLLDETFAEQVTWRVAVPDELVAAFTAQVGDATAGAGLVQRAD
jgi:uncharacterized YigZ family protein